MSRDKSKNYTPIIIGGLIGTGIGLVLLFFAFITAFSICSDTSFAELLFPLYFGLKAIGLKPPPTTWQVYIIAFVFYAGALPLLWKQKRDYARYLLATQQPSSAVA